MLVIHKDTCPALCQMKRFWRGRLVQFECNHHDHACTCSAPTAEQLRELVEAAELAVEFPEWAYTQTGKARLDAAVEPWRKAMGRPEPPPEKS